MVKNHGARAFSGTAAALAAANVRDYTLCYITSLPASAMNVCVRRAPQNGSRRATFIATMPHMITLQDIQDAALRLQGQVLDTPCVES